METRVAHREVWAKTSEWGEEFLQHFDVDADGKVTVTMSGLASMLGQLGWERTS